MICNPTVDGKLLIVKASKNKKIQQKHKMHAPLRGLDWASSFRRGLLRKRE